MTSLEDLLCHALPGEPEVLVGAQSLARSVNWVVRLRARAPGLPPLTGGEAILAATAALESLNARPTLAQVVEQVAALGGVALFVIGQIDAAAECAAEHHRLPLVLLHGHVRAEAFGCGCGGRPSRHAAAAMASRAGGGCGGSRVGSGGGGNGGRFPGRSAAVGVHGRAR
jgi:hypothetical protein